jgi:hypothetical protein
VLRARQIVRSGAFCQLFTCKSQVERSQVLACCGKLLSSLVAFGIKRGDFDEETLLLNSEAAQTRFYGRPIVCDLF